MPITLQPGVELHVTPTTKFKTVRVMIRFAAPLEIETISKRTLLTSLLETNTKKYDTQVKVSEKLADLYGASFGLNVTKKGNEHYVTVHLNLVNDKFLPSAEPVLAAGVDFLKEVLFQPNLEDGAFEAETFQREQKNLQSYLESVFDDKQSQAALKLQELYFGAATPQGIPSFGRAADVAQESPESMASYYARMLAEDQIMITVVGDVTEAQMAELFASLPFPARSVASTTPFYQQASYDVCQEQTEREPVAQAKLNLAFQTGIYYGSPAYFALQVFNGIFGGFPHSKLFMNVREKESMAYYASSSIDTFRGLLTVQTGIDGRNKERVLTLIKEQLQALQAGEISADELAQTKEMLKNQYLLSLDNPAALSEAAYLKGRFKEARFSTEEWLQAVAEVSEADVQAVAQQINLQAIYFMEGDADDGTN